MQSAIIIFALFRVVNNDMGITGGILPASSHLCYFCSAIKKNSNLYDTWPCSTLCFNMYLGECICQNIRCIKCYAAFCMHDSYDLNNTLCSLDSPGLGCSPKANKIIFFQLKMDSSVVLSTDFEYMSQIAQLIH